MGCYGLAEILICRHKHSKVVGVVRQIDLEALDGDKFEEVSSVAALYSMYSIIVFTSSLCNHCNHYKLITIYFWQHMPYCLNMLMYFVCFEIPSC